MACLFISLAHFIQNMNERQLRDIICNYLAGDPKIYDDLSVSESIWENISINEYVENMRNDSVWGGSLEIKAFCDIFHINVILHYTQNSNTTTFISSTPNENQTITIHLTYNGNHFEPLSLDHNIN